MNLPQTTTKQQEILKLLYRHRFLQRKHIQQYLNHLDKRRSSRWLKDLKEKGFVDWIYDANNSNERSKPATFFLDTNGIRFLREIGNFSEDELRKRYKDNTRQQDFIERCLLLTECCLHLETRNKNDDSIYYRYALEADYTDPDSDHHFIAESGCIHPALVFTKNQDVDGDTASITYLAEFFDPSTPRYMVKKRLKGYVGYLASDDWEQAMGSGELPVILISCPTLAELIYAKRYTKKQLSDIWDGEIPEEIKIRFSTIEKIKAKGLTAVIWEDL